MATPALRLLIGPLLALLALAGCTPAAQPQTGGNAVPATEQRADSQVLRVGMRGMVGNPTPQSTSGDHVKLWPMYDKLTQFVGADVKPSVATSWTLSPDLKVWTFTIRKDLVFSNGDPLTANDVAFSLKTIKEKNWTQAGFFANVTDIRAVNDTTVEVTSKVPDVTVPNAGTYLFILPQKYFETIGFDGFVLKPIGSGPYEMVEFRTGDLLRFKKRAAPHPFRPVVIDELSFRSIDEASSIIAGLQTGEIDITSEMPFTISQVQQLKNAGIDVTPRLQALINMQIPQGAYESRNTPLKEPKVRLAIQYAINRDGIAKTLFGGLTQPAYEMSMPGSLYSLPGLKPVPYDPAKAKALLAEAGYPNGFKLPAGFDYNTVFTSQDVVVAVQSDLKAVGIEYEVHPIDNGLNVDKAYGRNGQTLSDLNVGRSPDVLGFGMSRTFVGCNKPVGGPKTSNVWCNQDWDQLMDQAYAEPDLTKRAALLQKANQLQMEAGNQVPLFYDPAFEAHTSKVKGVQYQHPNFYNFDTIYKIK